MVPVWYGFSFFTAEQLGGRSLAVNPTLPLGVLFMAAHLSGRSLAVNPTFGVFSIHFKVSTDALLLSVWDLTILEMLTSTPVHMVLDVVF